MNTNNANLGLAVSALGGIGLPVWPQHAVQYQALSPAKLNLFLHVTGRRPDGYHLLQSLFCPLAWGDTVKLTLQPVVTTSVATSVATSVGPHPSAPQHQKPSPVCAGWVFSRSGDLLHIAAERDLSWRAALALVCALPAPPQPMHLHIHVCKRIPEQAGLGGGSSNAATVLGLLNQALGAPLGLPGLAALALPLGADVPFFLHKSAAWVEGIGERVVPVALPGAWVLVYKPPVACPTQVIFAHPKLMRSSPALDWPFAQQGGVNLHTLCLWLRQHTNNALQAVVAQAVQGWQAQFEVFLSACMAQNALLVRMSGSGSAMFALFVSEADCQAALAASASLGLNGLWCAATA